MHWRRKWQPTPVFLPGDSQGQRSLVAAVYGVAQSWTRLKRLRSSRGEALAAWNYFSCCFSRTSEELTICFMSIMPFLQCRHSSLALLRHWAEIFGFSGGSDGKESTCNSGDPGLIPGSGRSPGEENGNPLHCSCLENPMDRGTWRVTVHGLKKSQTQQSN